MPIIVPELQRIDYERDIQNQDYIFSILKTPLPYPRALDVLTLKTCILSLMSLQDKHLIYPFLTVTEMNVHGIGQWNNLPQGNNCDKEPARIGTPLFDWWGWRFQSGIRKKKHESTVKKGVSYCVKIN
jgi:hypothetical protein